MAEMLRWMVLTFARFVGLSVMTLGAWVIIGNLVEGSYTPGTLALILGLGTAGIAGGLTYLLSFDGPFQFRATWVRVSGWAGMMISVLLPSSLITMLVPMVLIVFPTVLMTPDVTGTKKPVRFE